MALNGWLVGLVAILAAGCRWDHNLGYGPDDSNHAKDAPAGSEFEDGAVEASENIPEADTARGDAADVAVAESVEDGGSGDTTVDVSVESGFADASNDASLEAGPDGGSDALDASIADSRADAGGGGILVPRSGPVCSVDGWCWTSPLPQGNDLESVWGATSNDVWAVGVDKTMLHYDGTQWSGAAFGRPFEIVPLDEAGTTSTIWSESLGAIEGSGPSDVWAVGGHFGGGGEILHFDGTSWLESPGGSLAQGGVSDIWVGGKNEAWAVGVDQTGAFTFLHWNGTTWSTLVKGADQGFLGNLFGPHVWGSGPNDVWVIGTTRGSIQQGRVFHYDGSTWNLVHGGSPNSYYTAVGGTSTTDVWIGSGYAFNTDVEHWDGSSWTTTRLANASYYTGAITARGPNDVWLSNQTNGGVWHFDGQNWQLQPGSFAANGLWQGSASDIWGVGKCGQMEHFNGSTWSSNHPDTVSFNDVWGSSENDVWAAADELTHPGSVGAIVHWDGQAWSITATEPAVSAFTGIWGVGADVWAVGPSGTIVHRNGSSSTSSNPTSADLRDVSGTSVADVWTVGTGGTILHSNDGSSWIASTSNTTAELRSVWATSADDAWAVGAMGTVLHWNGQAWSAPSTGSSGNFFAVWASGPKDVWIVGDLHTVLHWDGSLWTTPNVSQASFHGVEGTGPSDVWLTGEMTYHWDGLTWKRSDTGTYGQPSAVWSNGRAAFLVGACGLAQEKRFTP